MPDKERIRIHLFHKLPTPYNDMLFRALHSHPNLDLVVYHLWSSRWNRPWTVKLATGYSNNYLKTRLGVDWNLAKRALVDRQSFFLVGDWAHAASIAVLLARILRQAPVSIWADTPQEWRRRPWLKRVLRRAFLSWLLVRMDVVFGTGQLAMDALVDMGAPRERVVNLPCFVDHQLPLTWSGDSAAREKSRAFRELVGCRDKGVVLLMAGTCIHRKGQDIGIRAFAACRETTNTDMGMIIAGDGPDRQRLEELARSLGVADRIAFLGWLDPEEMEAAYAACDIVLHSARWDPFPLVVLEGMSWGKVVIGSDVCGSVHDRIVHGVNGFVFPAEDIDTLTAIIKESVLQPQRRHEIGLEARRTAEAWPVERGVRTIVQSAQQALNGRRKQAIV